MRKTLMGVIAAASAATIVGGATLAAASPRPASLEIEHISLVRTSVAPLKASLIVSGVFTAGGIQTGPGNGHGRAVLPGGTFEITGHPGHVRQTFNPKTCLETVTGQATYTLSDGTGKYAGIKSSGKATVIFRGMFPRNSRGTCSPAEKPVVFQQIINGQGSVTM